MPIDLHYVRKSVSSKKKASTSIEKQMDGCATVSRTAGVAYEIFCDAEGHRSGRSENKRPEWLRLKERIRNARSGEIRAVVVFALDRSSRSPRDFYNFLALLQEKRVELISASQDLDTTTPFGRAFLGLAMIWASLEADIDSQRASETVAWKQQHGIHVGDTPIGYNRERKTISLNGDSATTALLVVNPEEAETVRQVYQLYASGEHSFRSLARYLNSLGKRAKNKNGQRNLFTHKNIQIILDNHWLYRGWVVRREGESDEEKVKGVHEAIIGDELAEAAAAVKMARRESIPMKRGNQRRLYILNPLYCACCGKEMRGFYLERSGHVYRHREPKGDCPVVQVKADFLEGELLRRFEGLEFTDEEVQALQKFWDLSALEAAGDDTKKALESLENRRNRAKKLYLAGDLNDDEYSAEKRHIEAEEAVLRQKAPRRKFTAGQLAAVVKQFGVLINKAEPENQKRMIAAMYERLETDGETLTLAKPRPWFLDFFQDMQAVVVQRYPQGNSNPRRHLERVVS